MIATRPFELDDARRLVTAPALRDSKYTRGVTLLATGSEEYPGAAVLSCAGALAGGAGFMRYLGPETPTSLVLSRLPEVVVGGGRADAAVIGSGIGSARDDARATELRELVEMDLPTVVDAGALELIADTTPKSCILTPHEGELDKLCEQLGLGTISTQKSGRRRTRTARGKQARSVAEHTGQIVLIKGAATRVVSPGAETAHLIEAPSHWAATAGTGDVLSGMIGAFLAGAAARSSMPLTNEEMAWQASLGAWVHAWAAWTAARRASGDHITAEEVLDAMSHPAMAAGFMGPIRASDLARAVPTVLAATLAEA